MKTNLECFDNNFKTYEEFKKHFVLLKPSDFINCYEKAQKPKTCSNDVTSMLFYLWVDSSRNSIIEDDLKEDEFLLVLRNKNLFLTEKIRAQSNSLYFLNRKLSNLKKLDIEKLNSPEILSICEEFSQNLLVCFELLYFRQFLIQSCYQFQKFSFINVAYLHLILLIDGELYMFVNRIYTFLENFSNIYKIEKN